MKIFNDLEEIMDAQYIWLIAGLGWVAATVLLLAGLATDRRRKILERRLAFVRRCHEKSDFKSVPYQGTRPEITEMVTAMVKQVDSPEAIWYATQLEKDCHGQHRQGEWQTTLFVDKDKSSKVKNLLELAK